MPLATTKGRYAVAAAKDDVALSRVRPGPSNATTITGALPKSRLEKCGWSPCRRAARRFVFPSGIIHHRVRCGGCGDERATAVSRARSIAMKSIWAPRRSGFCAT